MPSFVEKPCLLVTECEVMLAGYNRSASNWGSAYCHLNSSPLITTTSTRVSARSLQKKPFTSPVYLMNTDVKY